VALYTGGRMTAIAAVKPPYSSPDQAYAHLGPETSYAPYEVREDGDWVLVLFTETGVARLFATLQEVGRRYTWSIYRHDVYVSAAHLSAKVPTETLRSLAEKVGLDTTGSSLEVATILWNHYQQHGDRVTNRRLNLSSNSADEDKYLVRVDLLKDERVAELLTTLPKQAQVIAKALADAERSTYTEEELVKFSSDLLLTGKLKTKQDPFRVVRYYAPALYDLGVMRYESRRVEVEDAHP
jgi:hypothetical protein